MKRSWHVHAPLALIAVSLGWTVVAVIFALLAEARWGSVLWASLERLFVVLAVTASTLALALIGWRSLVLEHSHRIWLILRRAPGISALLVVAWWVSTTRPDMGPGLLLLGGLDGILIALDRQRPTGGDGVAV